MMKLNKLATLLLTTTLTLAGGAAYAADESSSNGSNGDANAGQVARDAKQNVAPNNVDNSNINTGNTNSTSTQMEHKSGHISKEEEHTKTMCKDSRCPDVNKKVKTGSGDNSEVNTMAPAQ